MVKLGTGARAWIGAVAVLAASACGTNGTTASAPTNDPGSTASEQPTATDSPSVSDAPDSGSNATSVRMGALTFASRSTPLALIVDEAGIEGDHGIDLEPVMYSDGAAYYAGLVSGEVDILLVGTAAFQSMYGQDVPIKVVATGAGFNAKIFTTNDDIQSIQDLPGHSLAATTAFSEYQNLVIAAEMQGVDLAADVTVVDTQPPDVLTQLKADRVDAGLAWAPGAAVLEAELSDARAIYDAAEGWQEVTGLEGWELVLAAREDWIDEAGPDGVQSVIDALAAAAQYIDESPAEAAQIFEATTSFPADLFEEIVAEEGFTGVLRFGVEPIWEGSHPEEVVTQFEAAVEAGFADSVPDNDALYSP